MNVYSRSYTDGSYQVTQDLFTLEEVTVRLYPYHPKGRNETSNYEIGDSEIEHEDVGQSSELPEG